MQQQPPIILEPASLAYLPSIDHLREELYKRGLDTYGNMQELRMRLRHEYVRDTTTEKC